jgi:hypothetical protein
VRAINHALTGAILGLALANPVALPLAVVSHYVMDGLPHHDWHNPDFKSLSYRIVLLVDVLLCVALTVVITLKHPADWWVVVLSAFLAASPDFMWLGDFFSTRGWQPQSVKRRHAAVRLHAWVQWFHKPLGLVVEAAWALAAIIVLVILLKA